MKRIAVIVMALATAGLVAGSAAAETVLIDMAADASTWSSRQDWNRGAFHRSDSRYVGGTKQMGSFMKFDIDMDWLQGLGSGEINSATFKGNGWAIIENFSFNPGHELQFIRITESDWVEGIKLSEAPGPEGGANWLTTDGSTPWATGGTPGGVQIAATETWSEAPLELDFTDAVKAWADGEPNYGIHHQQANYEGPSTCYSSFWSREAEADQATYPGAIAPQLEIVYGEAQQITGDANLDGTVDDADLSLLLAHWNQDVTGDPDGGWGKGEFNATAPVQDADLSLLLANWTGAAAVPEPVSVLLVLAGLPIAARRRRK